MQGTDLNQLYGLLAEFEGPEELVAVARSAYAAGYRHIEGYSPNPVEELAEAVGFRRTWIPGLVLLGGVMGGMTAYSMQWWIAAVDYPLNVGGRPYHSWPSFIPITFELTVLFAAFFAFFGVMILNRLPMPYHPVFHIPEFERASKDGFFFSIEATDPKFDLVATTLFLEENGAKEVWPLDR